jgi:hypothetical protein
VAIAGHLDTVDRGFGQASAFVGPFPALFGFKHLATTLSGSRREEVNMR